MSDFFIGERLREARERAGLTQRTVADRLKIHRQTISCFENNTRNPNIKTLVALADIYGTSTDYLLGRLSPYARSGDCSKMKIVLDDGAFIPYKAHLEDAGFDIMAKEGRTVPAHGSAIFDTGVHIEIPQGFVGFLKSKSGLNVKYGITSEGVIDAGYTGSITAKLYNNSYRDYEVRRGDKITQLVILPIATSVNLEQVDSLHTTARGSNGFGSSGR